MKHNINVSVAELAEKLPTAKIPVPRVFIKQVQDLLGITLSSEEIEETAPAAPVTKAYTGKKRGRPSKAEIAARKEAEEVKEEVAPVIEEEETTEEEENDFLSGVIGDSDESEEEEISEEENSNDRLDMIKASCEREKEFKTSYSSLTGPV